MKTLLVLCGLLFALATHGQTFDEFFSVPKSELKTHLRSLPTLCEPTGTWFNVITPNPLTETEGTLFLIHFGTFEDVVSRKAMADLDRLQHEYPRTRVILVVEPIHPYAQTPEAIQASIERLRIALPVLVDTTGQFHDCMNVDRLPMTLLTSPRGRVLGHHRGSLSPSQLSAVLDRLTHTFREFLDDDKERFYGVAPPRNKAEPLLRYPAGLAADPVENFIYVSDALNHRILGVTSQGNTIHCIGSEQEGFADGNLQNARFNHPTGLAYDVGGGHLYVADTYNHRVRRIDFARDSVSTVLGNGRLPQPSVTQAIGAGGSIGFPIGLELEGNALYVTTAGPAAGLWKMDIRTGVARKIVGTDTGSTRPTSFRGAGIAVDPTGAVFFNDPLNSSLRYRHDGAVTTVIGRESSHGYRDGKKDEIRLQYPGGMTSKDEKLYIADTYNHAIRVVEPFKPRSSTLIGTGQPGFADGPAETAALNSPTDVVFMNGLMYIADAGNGAVRVFDPETYLVHTLILHNHRCIGHDKSETIMDLRDGPTLTLNKTLTNLEFHLDLGPDFEMDPEGFSQVSLITRRSGFVLRDTDLSDGRITAVATGEPEDRGSVAFDLRLFIRNVVDGRQYYRALTLYFPVEVKDEAPKTLEIELPISVE